MISIEGNIGAGKSTLVNILKKAGMDAEEEPVADWKIGKIDLLKQYYDDPKKYAFLFQSFILHSRKQHEADIIERSLFSDKIFAEAQFRLGNLDVVEFETYKNLHGRFPQECAGRIYIETSTETCLQRIRTRGRDGESVIKKDYLSLLQSLHEEALSKEKHVLVIDGEQDFSTESVQKNLIEKIEAFQQFIKTTIRK